MMGFVNEDAVGRETAHATTWSGCSPAPHFHGVTCYNSTFFFCDTDILSERIFRLYSRDMGLPDNNFKVETS